jgi:hypothetical protein
MSTTGGAAGRPGGSTGGNGPCVHTHTGVQCTMQMNDSSCAAACPGYAMYPMECVWDAVHGYYICTHPDKLHPAESTEK